MGIINNKIYLQQQRQLCGLFYTPFRSFATKMMAGSTKNKKDSAGRRLGLKKWGHGAPIFKHDIILRQRGHKWHPGMHVHSGKDHTLHASVEGQAAYTKDKYSYRKRSRVHMIPMEHPNKRIPIPPPFVFHPELFPELAENNP